MPPAKSASISSGMLAFSLSQDYIRESLAACRRGCFGSAALRLLAQAGFRERRTQVDRGAYRTFFRVDGWWRKARPGSGATDGADAVGLRRIADERQVENVSSRHCDRAQKRQAIRTGCSHQAKYGGRILCARLRPCLYRAESV